METLETKEFNLASGDLNESFSELTAKEIHLWRVSLNPSQEVLLSCQNALSTAEKGRVEFFSFDQVKQNYLVSQGVLRVLLGKYLGINPQEVELGRHSKGKPFCKQDPNLYFNISNSGGKCVYAFSRKGEIGIDLEKIRPLSDLDEMIEKNFSAQEQSYIQKKSAEKLRRFFLFWTIKESYLKAIGEGMRIEPQNLEFTVQNQQIKLIGIKGYTDFEDWNFKEVPFDKTYIRTLTYLGDSVEFQDFEII
ncbi:MAG: 4'-phosphopantetheinyl transferase superfamily protein [Flavobacteriales bacterium]|nr:4'-phosphopantetheinyl transferase superfamily protein [Flavobacteriales bacterium]